jgi:hypothetical protein
VCFLIVRTNISFRKSKFIYFHFRSISEVGAPVLPNNLDDKNKNVKPVEESVKKVKKLSETISEQCPQNLMSYVLPNEMDNDIKPCIEKLVKVSFYLFFSL